MVFLCITIRIITSSAKRRLLRNYPSILTLLFSQSNLNMQFSFAVNSLSETASPCVTSLLILIVSLYLDNYNCYHYQRTLHKHRAPCYYPIMYLIFWAASKDCNDRITAISIKIDNYRGPILEKHRRHAWCQPEYCIQVMRDHNTGLAKLRENLEPRKNAMFEIHRF